MRLWQQVLTEAAAILREAGVEPAVQEARRILTHHMGGDGARLMLYLRDKVDPQVEARFMADVHRRADRHPLSHITGRRSFYGHEFIVTPDVLDPRPETEVLVEAALSDPPANLLDLGTGSGAILLSILAHSNARGLGVDISPDALNVADRNAKALGLADRAVWQCSDWFGNVEGRFDLIISNPPYIAAKEMSGLSPEVLREPAMALTDGADGLSAYRNITSKAHEYLRSGGRIILEIGPTQAREVSAMFLGAGWHSISTIYDLDGRDRGICAYKTDNS